METLKVTLADNKGSIAVAVNDTSITPVPPSSPTYTLTAPVGVVNEGGRVRFDLDTRGVPEGTRVAYRISGISADDLESGSLTGVLTIDRHGRADVDIWLEEDRLTEGAETLKFELVNGKGSVAVTVNDATLLTPAPGPRVLEGTDSNDVLNCHDGADTIYGRKGDDIIRGLGSNTSMSDHLHGNEGNDIFEFRNVNELRTAMEHGQEGLDTIRLLDGFNTVTDLDFKNNTSFSGQTANVSTVERLELQATGAVNVTLGTYASGIFGSNGDDVPVIEALHTSSLKLNATASDFYNDLKVLSGAGNDDIATGKKNDWIDAGAGDDTIKAGAGDNTINGGAGNDSITSGNDEDFIDAGADNDVIRTGDKDDTIDAGGGDDVIDAGADDDIILGDAGSDKIDGGMDDDRVVYAGNRSGYQVIKLNNGPEGYEYSVASMDGSVDRLSSIELIEFADTTAKKPSDWASAQGPFTPQTTAERSSAGTQQANAAGFMQPVENALPDLELTAAEHPSASTRQADAVGSVHIEDVDSPELGGATITLFEPRDGDRLDLDGFTLRNEDGRIMIDDTGIEIVGGTYASDTGTLTLSGHAPPETNAAVLQSLVLESLDGSGLTPGTRSIGVKLVDSAGAASTQKTIDIVIEDAQPTVQSNGEGFASPVPPDTMQDTAGTDSLLLAVADNSYADDGSTASWADQVERNDAPAIRSSSVAEFDEFTYEPIQPFDDFQTDLDRVSWS